MALTPSPRTPEDVRTDPRVGDTWTSFGGVVVYTVVDVDADKVDLARPGGTCTVLRAAWALPGGTFAPGPCVPPSTDTAARLARALADDIRDNRVSVRNLGNTLCRTLDLDPDLATWDDVESALRALGDAL